MSPKVVFFEPGGHRRELEARVGISLMEVAKQHDVAGIVALCGGACACATCHVYIEPAWLDRLDRPEDMELGMLESAFEPRANSRLSCQIAVTPALDGLEVRIPARQA
jgi:2Fe-2S ferredoxin